MASQQAVAVLAPRAVDFCPSPLHVRRKGRRATFYKRLRRSSTNPATHNKSVYGPLDDIINEISCEIWNVPFNAGFERCTNEVEDLLEALLGWQDPPGLSPSSTLLFKGTVLPLLVSRRPSDLPLIVRKNRNSRSTASDSSFGMTMGFSGESSRNQSGSTHDVSVGSRKDSSSTPWPLINTASDTTVCASNPAASTDRARSFSVQQAGPSDNQEKTQSSRRRFFSKGFSRLRRANTDDVGKATAPPLGQSSSTASEREAQEPDVHSAGLPMGDAFAGLMSPFDTRQLQIDSVQAKQHNPELVSTMKVGIRIVGEDKILTHEEVQEMWLVVELEGLLHNRQQLPNDRIDIAFIIDNSYRVSKETLIRSLDTISGAFNYLQAGDRVALYATHCIHETVTDTVPDLLFPLRPSCQDTEDVLRKVMSTVEKGGCQLWNPPRPNPSTADVILAVAKSLETSKNRPDRTHLVLLSPNATALHTVSESFPQLHVHQVNTAILPYQHTDSLRDEPCSQPCCQNMFVYNWMHYQSLPVRMKQIIHFARSEKPIGDITNLHIDVRTKKGCEILEILGSTDMDTLRLGQTHSFFLRIRITREDTEELNLESPDPILHSSLDANYWREDLHNCKYTGGSIAHLLAVQLMHQSSLQAPEAWTYTEAQLLVTKDQGRIQRPLTTYMELQNRLLFYKLGRLSTAAAKAALDELAVQMQHDDDEDAKLNSTPAAAAPVAVEGSAAFELRRLRAQRRADLRGLVERLATELYRMAAVQEYEERSRARLAAYPGPVRVAAVPHEWLVALWDAGVHRGGGF